MTMQQVSMKDMGLFGPILEQAIDGVVVIDHANSVVLFNAAAERMWGLKREEVLGRNVSLLVPEEHRKNHDAGIDRNPWRQEPGRRHHGRGPHCQA